MSPFGPDYTEQEIDSILEEVESSVHSAYAPVRIPPELCCTARMKFLDQSGEEHVIRCRQQRSDDGGHCYYHAKIRDGLIDYPCYGPQEDLQLTDLYLW